MRYQHGTCDMGWIVVDSLTSKIVQTFGWKGEDLAKSKADALNKAEEKQ